MLRCRPGRTTSRSSFLPVQKLGLRGLRWLSCPPTPLRVPVWTRCEFTSKLTEHTHTDVADKVKFTETDRNAPTRDYS